MVSLNIFSTGSETGNAFQEGIVGFIDLGTNSARLLLVRIQANGSYAVLSERKESVRLGEGEFESNQLQPEAMERAIAVCKRLVEMAENQQAQEIVAVATSATREAQNQAEFLTRLEEETGLHFRVVSGIEEARLIYLGVASGVHMEGRKGVFIDIGGGSTEIIVGDQNRYHYLDTTRLGAIRLTNLFLKDEEGPLDEQRYREIKSYVEDIAVRVIQAARLYAPEMGIGSSGTIENLADIAIREFEGRSRQPDDLLSRDHLNQTIARLRQLSLTERRKVQGINPERADIILGGAAILDTFMDQLDLDELTISERNMRDGLLVDYIRRAAREQASEGEASIRLESVLRLGRALNFEEEHARKVAELSLALFDSAYHARLHDMSRWERELLYYAALLHDVGVSLSYDGHHAHSAYFIRNADLLGFDQQEISIMAATAYFHRKAYPRMKHDEFVQLDPMAREIVRHLSVFLSLAESLDRSHMGFVTHAELQADPSEALLKIHASEEAPLETAGVRFQRKPFQKIFARDLRIESVMDPEAGND